MLIIRRLSPGDLEGALTLSSTAGWNQGLHDWRMLLALAPDGSFAAVSDERIVGTAIGIDYGGFGWIAMMLVDPSHRGRGLGRRLLEAAMDALPPDRPIRLDATPLGRPLYQRYGFVDEALLSRHVADVSSREIVPDVSTKDVRALVSGDLSVVADEDGPIFGGNRRPVLDWAVVQAPQYAHVIEGDSGVLHYCLGRQGRLFDQIGPIVTADDAVARALVAASLPAAEGRAVVIDAFDACEAFSAWLTGCGFRVERPLFRMSRPAGRPDRETGNRRPTGLEQFAIFGPEFG